MEENMKAIVYNGKKNVDVENVEDPKIEKKWWYNYKSNIYCYMWIWFTFNTWNDTKIWPKI